MIHSVINLVKESLRSSVSSAILILKIIIPFYILADVLIYLDVLQYISFIFIPLTSALQLPAESAMALAGGILFNVYAAIAFAAPLGLSLYQWTILGVFIGVCHGLIVESAIMAKLGVSYGYSVILRLVGGFIAVAPLLLMPSSLFSGAASGNGTLTQETFATFWQMLMHSTTGAVTLSIKVITLITVIIVCMDMIKALPVVKKKMEQVNTSFSILVGQLLGITYGASILIREVQRGTLSRRDIFFVATFLMICHSIIEDILLFVIFGASFWVIFTLRVVAAVVVSYVMLLLVPRVWPLERFVRI
ncbi:MAG: nucleoside recognition protein [Desulfobulbus propionicus]|nr:MAG: nucleoside recognition protein [Desulfobulbus propionicus]